MAEDSKEYLLQKKSYSLFLKRVDTSVQEETLLNTIKGISSEVYTIKRLTDNFSIPGYTLASKWYRHENGSEKTVGGGVAIFCQGKAKIVDLIEY